jgi:hypothetical protein
MSITMLVRIWGGYRQPNFGAQIAVGSRLAEEFNSMVFRTFVLSQNLIR